MQGQGQVQDLPTVTLPRWYVLASRLPGVDDESAASEEARRFILEHAKREMNAVGIANLLFTACSMYVEGLRAHGMNTDEARLAAREIVKEWAKIIVEDNEMRRDALHELDQMIAQAERPRG